MKYTDEEDRLTLWGYRAVLPWKSIDAEIGETRRTASRAPIHTDQALIDRCLRCDKPRCDNCLGERKITVKRRDT